jgi:glyoxylase-like metal-dependent hydrolase (beta-lactamase superfamily II)
MWSPMSSTLIDGAQEAILVDTFVTVAQVYALAEWVRGFGKRITGVYITHGHFRPLDRAGSTLGAFP